MEKKNRAIVSLLVITALALASVVNVFAATSPNLVPTFHKGFSAGLRSAPMQCVTEVLVDNTAPNYARTLREACGKVNQRKNFCVDYCINKVERDRKASRAITFSKVPKAACMKPLLKTFASVEDCIKDRTRHCAVNCESGRDQSKCSSKLMAECRKIGKGVYKIV